MVSASAEAITPAGTAPVLNAKLDQIAASPEGPPGVSVLIQRNGKVEYRRRGFGDVPNGVPRLASVTTFGSRAFRRRSLEPSH